MKSHELVSLPLTITILDGPAFRLDDGADVSASHPRCHPAAEALAKNLCGGPLHLELDDGPSLSAGEEAYRGRAPVPWEGPSMNVACSFFQASEIEVVIDMLFRYRFNTLHLYLTDDQGWRHETPSVPEPAEVSGKTTAKEYAAGTIRRRILSGSPLIPTRVESGSSWKSAPPATPTPQPTLAGTGAERVNRGDYVRIGGDEDLELEPGEYRRLVEAASDVVQRARKWVTGWQKIAGTDLEPGSVIQFWDPCRDLSPLVEAA